jgi:hypothetical protein
MRTVLRLFIAVSGFAAGIAFYTACGDDEETGTTAPPDSGAFADSGPRGIEQAGQACTSAAQCYPDKAAQDAGEAGAQLDIKGTIFCETKIPNGYCTHECTADTDCCAVPGECRTAIKQVCSPFTNTETPKYCFLSCEEEDIKAAITANVDAGGWDGGAVILDGSPTDLENGYCYHYASIYATCRSSGGGSQNRKVCIPQQ